MKNQALKKFISALLCVATIFTVSFASCNGSENKKDNSGATMSINPIFCDNMVLQANKTIRVFGEGDGTATVTINDVTKQAQSVDGKWLVELPAFDYGGPYSVTIQTTDEEKCLQDVYFGDVYLLAGQSNMQFKMKNSSVPRTKWKKNPLIRYYSLDSLDAYEHFSTEDGWVLADSFANIEYMSAIGYQVGLNVNQATDRAIGLVACYQGASVIETWLPEDICAKEEYNQIPEGLKHNDHYASAYKAWNEKPGTLYHYMFEKILPFRFADVFWYQGESNTSELETEIYASMVVELINRWRADLQDQTLPFVLIQIADWNNRRDIGWTGIQAAQETVPTLVDDVIFIVSKDVCDTTDIHPADKTALAARISDALLK